MAADFYLQLDGIQGESQVTNFKNWIQVQSYSFGGNNLSSSSVGTGSGAGKVSMSPLTITKQVDSASPTLFQNMCAGTHIATGKLAIVKAGATSAYLTISLTEVFVSTFVDAGASEIPTETISLTAKSFLYQYSVQDNSGNLSAKAPKGWDVAANKAV